MKKLIALLMVIAMVACLFAGCGETDKQGSDAPQGDGDVGTTQNGGNDGSSGEADYSKMKIGMLLNNTVTDGGWNQAMAESMERSKKELGLKDSQIIRKNNIPDTDTAKTQTAIEELVEEGCQVIFGTSFNYMNTMEELAKDHPSIIFSHGTGYKNNGVNLNNYFGRIYQARYLAGIAAGADGLIIEVHPNPKVAMSDAAQQLTIPDYGRLVQRAGAVAQALGRTL